MDEKELWKAVGSRLAAARGKAGFATQKAFAQAVSLSTPTIAKYEQGVREIPLTLLHWLSEQRGINASWIITGEGDIFEDPSKAPSAPIVVKEADFRQFVDTMGRISQSLEPPPPPPTTIRYLPLMASAGGGAAVLYESGGSEMDMDRLARDVFNTRPKDILLMRIKGESMEPILSDGDFAVVDTSRREPEDGHIYIVSIGGELYAKRADGTDPEHYFVWRSENDLPQYAPISITRAEMDKMNIVGEVFSVIRAIAPRRRRP